MHNVLTVAPNSTISITSKVKENILHIMIALFNATQPAIATNLGANAPYALLKVPNALVTKQVHMPSRKIKATKAQPELTEVHA